MSRDQLETRVTGEQISELESILQRELSIIRELETLTEDLMLERKRPANVQEGEATAVDLLARIDQRNRELEVVRRETLAGLSVGGDVPVRLSRAIAQCDHATMERFRALRQEIISKLTRIRSMNLASQMSLLYRIDFGRQLLASLSGQGVGDVYHSTGRVEPAVSGQSIVQDC